MEAVTRGKTLPGKTTGTSKTSQPSQTDRRSAFEASTRLGLVRKALRQS